VARINAAATLQDAGAEPVESAGGFRGNAGEGGMMAKQLFIEVAPGKVVEADDDCCYPPDENGHRLFNCGGFDYASGPEVEGPATHYFDYSGSLFQGSVLKKVPK
jgi:hypothetical protein